MGKALPFYTSLRLEIKRTEIITQKDVPIGQKVKIYVRKNKVGSPFGIIETDLMFGIGFDEVLETVQLAIDYGIITKAASWLKITHGEDSLMLQGRENMVAHYKQHPEHYEELKRWVLSFREDGVVENSKQASIVLNEGHDEDGY